jgi:hypothetical protein
MSREKGADSISYGRSTIGRQSRPSTTPQLPFGSSGRCMPSLSDKYFRRSAHNHAATLSDWCRSMPKRKVADVMGGVGWIPVHDCRAPDLAVLARWPCTTGRWCSCGGLGSGQGAALLQVEVFDVDGGDLAAPGGGLVRHRPRCLSRSGMSRRESSRSIRAWVAPWCRGVALRRSVSPGSWGRRRQARAALLTADS